MISIPLSIQYIPTNKIKDTTESSMSASYLDILLNIDIDGKLTTQLYDKRDDFSSIVNFPYLCSNIPSSPAYGVYVSQLIRYTRACSAYDQFLNRGKLLMWWKGWIEMPSIINQSNYSFSNQSGVNILTNQLGATGYKYRRAECFSYSVHSAESERETGASLRTVSESNRIVQLSTQFLGKVLCLCD